MIYLQLNFNKKHLKKFFFAGHSKTIFLTKRQTPPLSIDKFYVQIQVWFTTSIMEADILYTKRHSRDASLVAERLKT